MEDRREACNAGSEAEGARLTLALIPVFLLLGAFVVLLFFITIAKTGMNW